MRLIHMILIAPLVILPASVGRAQTTATVPTIAPYAGQTTAATAPGTPLTKDEIKAQRKQQKQQEKAAMESAKAQKDSANALKHQDKALNAQEKANPVVVAPASTVPATAAVPPPQL